MWRLCWLLLAAAGPGSANKFRCAASPPESPRFYFAGACVRSKMTMVAASYSANLDSCAKFARRRRGLAVNFLNRDFLHPPARNYSRETCLVFDCPEFDVQMSLEIDSLYDYYSTYARPMPNSNVTCIPRVGVFELHHEKLNFTDSEEACQLENSHLADVTTGPRSSQLARVLIKQRVRSAYIGLAQDEGRFITPEGMLLECLPYRGWAPGHPRKGRKCAALTDKGLWVSEDCNKKLPFLCELEQSGPLHPCINLPREIRWRCRDKFVKSFPSKRRRPQCGDPQIDENTFRLPFLQATNGTRKANSTNEDKNVTKPPRRIPNKK